MSESESILVRLPDDGLHGRRKIFTNKKEITPENVVDVVNTAYGVHCKNRREIQYLYKYYRGEQDIRFKEKVVRQEINNKIMVNRANEIVTFKTSYLLGEPLQYVSTGGDDSVSERVNRLNKFMRSEDKDSKDTEIADWIHIAGVAERMVLPDPVGEEDGSPANIFTLDPCEAFVIYYSGIGQRPLVGVLRQKNEEGKWISCAYTKDRYYEILNGKITNENGQGKTHALGRIPIIEYVNNDARIGAFEVVLPILNAINTMVSNRVDSVEDFVNAFDVFQNCEIPNGTYAELSKGGMAIQIKSTGAGADSKVYRITSELNQTGTQTIVDDLKTAYLEICGMPNRNGGSSTSDTGQAVLYRDGFEAAESRAKHSEKVWKRSEREFLRLFLRICRDTTDLNLELHQIKPEFTRKNFANIQSKAQVLNEMLNNSKIHPKLAFQYSGMFTDAEEAYRISMEWYEQQQAKQPDNLPPDGGAAEKPEIPNSGDADQKPTNIVQRST